MFTDEHPFATAFGPPGSGKREGFTLSARQSLASYFRLFVAVSNLPKIFMVEGLCISRNALFGVLQQRLAIGKDRRLIAGNDGFSR